jgi:hypothetical protein
LFVCLFVCLFVGWLVGWSECVLLFVGLVVGWLLVFLLACLRLLYIYDKRSKQCKQNK